MKELGVGVKKEREGRSRKGGKLLKVEEEEGRELQIEEKEESWREGRKREKSEKEERDEGKDPRWIVHYMNKQ